MPYVTCLHSLPVINLFRNMRPVKTHRLPMPLNFHLPARLPVRLNVIPLSNLILLHRNNIIYSSTKIVDFCD